MYSTSRLLGAGLIFAALVLAGLSGCVTSPDGGGVMSGGGGGGGKNPAIIKIDGREVKADELIKSPVFRQALRQWAAIEHIKQEAAAAGIKPDSVQVENDLAEQKSQMAGMGQKWEDVLKQQGMIEAEVQQMMEFQDVNKQLALKKAGEISDEELQAEWDKREMELRDAYAAEKFLPESKKKELMFTDVKDWLKEQMVNERSMQLQQEMFMDAMKAVKLEFLPLSSEEQKTYYDLIIGSQLPEEEPKPEEGIGADGEAAPEDGAPTVEGGEAPVEGENPSEAGSEASGDGDGAPAEPPATPPTAPPTDGGGTGQGGK